MGWAAAMAFGTVEAYRTPGNGQVHFGASAAPVFGHVTYIAVSALVLNLTVTVVLTLVFRRPGCRTGTTRPGPLTTPWTSRPACRPSRTRGAHRLHASPRP